MRKGERADTVSGNFDEFLVKEPDSILTLVCLLSVNVLSPDFIKVNKTSTVGRLAPGSTVYRDSIQRLEYTSHVQQ